MPEEVSTHAVSIVVLNGYTYIMLERGRQQTVFEVSLPPSPSGKGCRRRTRAGVAETSRGGPLTPQKRQVPAEDRQELSRLQGDHVIQAEDTTYLLQQPRSRWCEAPVEERSPCFGLPRFSKVPSGMGGLRFGAWAFQMCASQMTESGSTAHSPPPQKTWSAASRRGRLPQHSETRRRHLI